MAGSIYLSLIFTPSTTILDMVPGIFLLGIGMGIVFPHSANIIFSVARSDQQPDASGIMNTGINLGSSLGTAVLGVILIIGSFSGMSIVFNNQTTSSSEEQIIGIHQFFEKIEPNNPENINEKQIMASPQKVQTMKFAFNIITIILIIGFLSSMLIPPQKRKHKPTLVGVTSHI
jgi:hypothetical protein